MLGFEALSDGSFYRAIRDAPPMLKGQFEEKQLDEEQIEELVRLMKRNNNALS